MTEPRHKIRPYSIKNCYIIPIRYLYGTAAEINFWDVIYYRAFKGQGSFDTSTQELVEQMGFSRQMVGRLRQQALEEKQLVQDISWVGGNRFALHIPNYASMRRGVVWKPLGYVSNGWHLVIEPAIPKRILNLFLQQPRHQVYHLDVNYIADKCKRRYLYDDYRPTAPLNQADVGKALRLLVRMGLLSPEDGGFRLEWARFNQAAPGDGPLFDEPDPREHPSFVQAAAADAARAELALELLDLGHYDLDMHLADIFRDLIYVRSSDYPVLKAKVYRHRNRPPGDNRWLNTWRAFQYELRRRIAEVRAPKNTLSLADKTLATCQLDLNIEQAGDQVLAVRLVSRVEWPWYMNVPSAGAPDNGGESDTPPHSVRLELQSNNQILFKRVVEPNDAEVRYTLHPEAWSDPNSSLMLAATCAQPLPGVHVEAWLEARLRR